MLEFASTDRATAATIPTIVTGIADSMRMAVTPVRSLLRKLVDFAVGTESLTNLESRRLVCISRPAMRIVARQLKAIDKVMHPTKML